jgi:HlyD family secretion protein
MKRSIVIAVVAVVAVGAVVAARSASGNGEPEGPAAVEVKAGDVVQKALAVGTIEPEVEVEVKSKVSGVVRRLFVSEGSFVEAGAALLEVRPDPTPLELVEARRQVQMDGIALENARKDLERQRALVERQLGPAQDLERAQREHDQAELRLRMAREKLQLLERGTGGGVESVVRSPIRGFILQKNLEVGDPVVPLSTYQEGTVLMTMADMGNLIFRGTVDEIDVGRLAEGQPVEIKIGALPEARIRGVVSRISLKARKVENATTFPVEIRLTEVGGATLRAGLSANAEIIIQRRERVLTVPERVVTFQGDTAWVSVQRADGTAEKRVIRTGLSDAIQVEVVSGLRAGEKVLEKPAKTIQ